MKLFILAQQVDSRTVAFHIVCPIKGLSPLYRMDRPSINGNAYIVYGDKIEEWTGKNKYSFSPVTMESVSGQIIDEHKIEEFLQA